MNLDCLIDYVGLENCLTDSAPESGQYINSLEGMTALKFDQIATDEDGGFAALWAKIQKAAANSFGADLQMQFAKRYKIRSATEFLSVPKNLNLNNNTLPAPNYSGHTIELKWPNTRIVNSNYAQIFIDSVDFFAYAAQTTTLKIIDLETGLILDTFTITSTAQGWQNKRIGKGYSAYRIFMAVDATSLTLAQNSIANMGYIQTYYNGQARVIGATIPKANVQNYSNVNFTQGSNTFGVAAKFTIRCVWDNLVCEHKDYFLNAWMYKLAMEFMNYATATPKINRWTTSDLPKMEKIMKLYNLKYLGGQDENGQVFEGYLYQAVDSLIIDCNDNCFFCNDTITFRTALM